ncbi:MAG: hypothetical protein N3C60_06995 [Calditerrivibrio sp.]|nr:hypothetical protein [Calditerrivibrio sp.]
MSVLLGMFRVEQAFGDNDITTVGYVVGQTKYKVVKEIADTTYIGQLAVSHNITKNVSIEIGSRVDINRDYKAYSGKGVLKVQFF